jgi:ribonuclease T2
MREVLVRGALGLLLVTTPTLAAAQARSCAMPDSFDMPRIERAQPDQVRRTPVTRYLLTLSWSPQHCFDAGRRSNEGRANGDALQCSGANGRFGFILHGLWPETDGENWPQYCAPARPLPRAVIARNLCMTPSPQLLQHEWSRHGVCMTRNPDAYFRAARVLYNSVRYPDMAALARNRRLTVRDFTRAFVAANPAYAADGLIIATNRGGWLDEVRLCLDRRFRPHRCPPASRGAPAGQRLRIAPVD